VLKPEPGLPLTVHMGRWAGPGFTAYGGLLHIGQLKDGEQVFVSTAARRGGLDGGADRQASRLLCGRIHRLPTTRCAG